MNEDLQLKNTNLYENMPSSELAKHCPPKAFSTSASSSSSSAGLYKTPVSKVSSRFLTADRKPSDSAQVTNTAA